MAEVCKVCGLPSDLCVCREISREQQRIRVRLEARKWGKSVTVVEGLEGKPSDLHELASRLKDECACGGTVKANAILLQGDHRERAKGILAKLGFPEQNIEVA